MTKDDRIASFKHSILQYARKHKNIIYTCRTFNLSRTVYYKWLKRFSKLGYLGLLDKKKAKPKMPNLDIQGQVLKYHFSSFSSIRLTPGSPQNNVCQDILLSLIF